MKKRKFKKKKDIAFNKVYEKHVDEIYRICLHYSRDEKIAQDATVQVFFDLYQVFEEIDEEFYRAYLVLGAKELAEKYKEEKISGEEERV